MKTSDIVFIFIVAHGSNVFGKTLSDKDLKTLIDVYDLKTNAAGVKVNQMWRSNKSMEGDPEASINFVVLNEKCSPWAVSDKDRLLVWNGGKAMINMIDENGNLTTTCLGETLDDITSKYVVHLPSGWKTNMMPDGYLSACGITLMGVFKDDATHIPYQEMEDSYPQHRELISSTKQCYPTT